MSRKETHKIPFAVDQDGNPASIHDVKHRGLACACTCPACKVPLVAKKGERRLQIWHFAHAAGSSCSGALESAIHIAVKKIISEERRMLLPPCHILRYPEDTTLQFNWTAAGEYTVPPYRYTQSVFGHDVKIDRCGGGRVSFPAENRMFEFDEVLEEVTQGNIRPDLVAVAKRHRLYIEVAVHHPVDGEKLRRLREKGVAAIQITVSPNDALAMNWEKLRQIVLDSVAGKAWVYNPAVEKKVDEDFESKAQLREQIKARAQHAARIKLEQDAREALRIRKAAQAAAAIRAQEQAEAAEQEMKRQAELVERNRLYAERRAAEEVVTAARRVQLQLEMEEHARKVQALQEARLERIRTQIPSFYLPLDEYCPVLFLDLDCIRKYGGIDLLGTTLGDSPCNLVVTSEIRNVAELSASDVAKLMAPLGGRPARFLPPKSKDLSRNQRRKEIDAWLEETTKKTSISASLIIDTGWHGLGYPHIVMGVSGFSAQHAKLLERFLRPAQC